MRRKIITASSVILVVAVGIVVWWRLHQPRPATVVMPSTTQTATQPAPQLDRMAIVAIRTRTYPGSVITTEQNLGDQGGYSNAIVSFQSDSLKEFVLMSTPNGTRPAGGWPVVILNHGYIPPGAYQTNGPEYRQFITALAQAGFMVVKPDYRGHGQSQGTPEGGHFSPAYAYDVLNLVASLKRDPTVNPKRIGQLGHSLGGHVTLRVDVVSPDIKASVFLAGVVGSFYDIFYNWPDSPAPHDQPAVVQQTGQALLDKYGNPKTNPDFWNSASAVNYVSAITGPVQVDVDQNDSTVPKLFSNHLVAALQQAGKAVDYHVFPGDDHQFSANRTAVLQQIISFFRANL